MIKIPSLRVRICLNQVLHTHDLRLTPRLALLHLLKELQCYIRSDMCSENRVKRQGRDSGELGVCEITRGWKKKGCDNDNWDWDDEWDRDIKGNYETWGVPFFKFQLKRSLNPIDTSKSSQSLISLNHILWRKLVNARGIRRSGWVTCSRRRWGTEAAGRGRHSTAGWWGWTACPWGTRWGSTRPAPTPTPSPAPDASAGRRVNQMLGCSVWAHASTYANETEEAH